MLVSIFTVIGRTINFVKRRLSKQQVVGKGLVTRIIAGRVLVSPTRVHEATVAGLLSANFKPCPPSILLRWACLHSRPATASTHCPIVWRAFWSNRQNADAERRLPRASTGPQDSLSYLSDAGHCEDPVSLEHRWQGLWWSSNISAETERAYIVRWSLLW